jgi:hypothetical protein
MAEVLLSTDEITVIGGPEKVSLTVDIGPEGTRGSYIFAGNGNPNDSGTIIGQSPNINDLFINLENTSEDFSYLYQYKAEPGGAVWQHILKLTPSMYAKNIVTSFVNGVSTIPVPIFDIITSTTDISNISELNFSVQCQVIGVKPVAASINLSALDDSDIVNLPITITASEYSEGAWQLLSGTKTVHLMITVV